MLKSGSRRLAFCGGLATVLVGFFSTNAHGTLGDLLVQKAIEAITKPLSDAVGVNAPVKLDQTTAYPKVDIQNFHPRMLSASLNNLSKPLPPGDYSLFVTAFCTDYSIHVPGRGAPYKLAPLMGRQSYILSAILARGTVQNVPHDMLQEINWRLQAGMPMDQWPADEQAIVHQLTPEYEQNLHGDSIAQINSQYEKVRRLPLVNLPPLDNFLVGTMGDAGRLVVRIERARQILGNNTASRERRPDLLYEATAQNDGLPRLLPPERNPEVAPWSIIRPGIIGRFIVQDGRMGQNLFQFRINPEALKTAKNPVQIDGFTFLPLLASLGQGPSEATILGLGDPPGQGASLNIGYSIGSGRQGLIMGGPFQPYQVAGDNIQPPPTASPSISYAQRAMKGPSPTDGSFTDTIKWNIANGSPNGGIIVQEVTASMDEIDKDGNQLAPKPLHYWEIWEVEPGHNGPIDGDNIEIKPQPYSGTLTVTAKAWYYDGATVPPGLVANNPNTAAHSLLSTTIDPTFDLPIDKMSIPVVRSISNTWNVSAKEDLTK